jgi:hypothetical protein
MRSVRTSITLLLLAMLGTVSGQQPEVSARLDTGAMLIGDHVGLTLKYTGPAASQVVWPFLPDTILGNISVIGRGKIDTALSADKRSVTLTQQLNLTCYDSGFYTFPQIPFPYRVLPDTTNYEVMTELMMLAVHTVRVDTTQAIKPIAGPLRVPISFREILPWILIGLAAALVIAGVIWYIRKQRKKEPILSLRPRVVIPPHEQALRDMEALRLKKLWQSGKVKEYHSELTEILRRYIETGFRVPALEQTTAEILDGLVHDTGIPRQALDRLGNLLLLADLVKFAKVQPLAAENEKSFTDGVEFVNETIQAGHA